MDLARGRRTDSDTGGDHWRDLALLDDADLRTAWSDLLNGRAPEIMEWIPPGESSGSVTGAMPGSGPRSGRR